MAHHSEVLVAHHPDAPVAHHPDAPVAHHPDALVAHHPEAPVVSCTSEPMRRSLAILHKVGCSWSARPAGVLRTGSAGPTTRPHRLSAVEGTKTFVFVIKSTTRCGSRRAVATHRLQRSLQ